MNKKHFRNRMFLKCWTAMLTCLLLSTGMFSQSLYAADLEGEVVQATSKSATITSPSADSLKIGDRTAFVYVIPGTEVEAQVASGKVTELDSPKVIVAISRSTGRVTKGQLARFTPSKPTKKPATARKTVQQSSPRPQMADGPGWLGVQTAPITPQVAEAAKLDRQNGVKILGLFPEGAGQEAGLQVGDIILQVGLKDIPNQEAWLTEIGEKNSGEEFQLTVIRDGRAEHIKVTLTPKPANEVIFHDMYVLARENEEAWAQYGVAQMYLGGGKRNPRYYQAALKYFEFAARQDHLPAMASLGMMYLNGVGTDKDPINAGLWFQKAAKRGNSNSQFYFARMSEVGYGVRLDYSEAVKWYHEAAKQNNAAAQCNLGGMCASGRGVQKDYEKAMGWIRLAADQEHALAEHYIGIIHQNGLGVSKSDSNAIKWYHKAAIKGHADAENSLGYLIAMGRGVQKDLSIAYSWWMRAARNGHMHAQENIGLCYLYGWGVRKNEVEGVAWLIKSSKKGNKHADQNLRTLGYRR